MILPRALPVMSGTRHSTSVMRCSLSQRFSELSCCSSAVCRGSFLRAIGSLPVLRALAAGGRERVEYSQIERILRQPPLRVPLHAEQERSGVVVVAGGGEADRLDQS